MSENALWAEERSEPMSEAARQAYEDEAPRGHVSGFGVSAAD